MIKAEGFVDPDRACQSCKDRNPKNLIKLTIGQKIGQMQDNTLLYLCETCANYMAMDVIVVLRNKEKR